MQKPSVSPRWLDLATAVPMFRNGPGALLKEPAEHMLGLPRMNRFLASLEPRDDPSTIFQRALDLLSLRYIISHGDISHIPESGPLIVVANHPFGGADALVLAHLLASRRHDMKMLANHVLGHLPGVRPWLILVDPFGNGGHSLRRNLAPMKETLAHLRAGGCLGMFPAGEVSSYARGHGVIDKPWTPHLAALIRKTGASVVPVGFHGRNSVAFHAAGMLHPLLRTAMLPREFMAQRGKVIDLRIGKALSAAELPSTKSDQELADSLRLRVELLEWPAQGSGRGHPVRLWPSARRPISTVVEPDPGVPAGILQQEIDSLPPGSLLATQGGLEVRIARAAEIPSILLEIGRLREITFRGVGEGTGMAHDTGSFDNYYLHLFLWDPEARAIAGAYRIGAGDEIMEKFGPRGFYTHTLFRFNAGFIKRLGPCLELGRSFIVPAYQRKPHSLYLLWKGIGAHVARNPRYRVLFGPVSISGGYSPSSRSLIAECLRQHHGAGPMSRMVRPRNPPWTPALLRRRHSGVAARMASVEELSSLIADIESDGKGIPILLRHYLKLNASILKFNVDPDFSDVLDSMIVVDLLAGDSKMMTRYMGSEGWAAFLAHHAAGPA